MDDLIKRCVSEGYEYQMHVWEQMDAGDAALSDVFQKRMERLIRRKHQSKVFREVRRYAVGAAAMFGVIILLLRPGYVTTALDFIMEWYDNRVTFELDEEITEPLSRYTVGYIPEGYELTDDVKEDMLGFQIMQKEDGMLVFTYECSQGTISMDNEDMDFETRHLSDGTLVYCFIGQGDKTKCSAMWFSENRQTFFSIIGDAPIEEILKMCESISEVL